MSLSKEQLIEKLVEATQLSPEVVQSELDAFVETILNVSKGNPLTIEGLGVFRLKKGRLAFETDPTLALEINYKYAGMMPLEIKKGSNEIVEHISSVESESDDEDGGEIPKEAPTDLGFQIGKVKPVEKKAETTPIEEPKKAEDPKAKEVVTVDELKSKPEEVKAEQPKFEKVETPKPKESTAKVEFKPAKSSSSKTILSVIAAAVVIIAVIYFLNKTNEQIESTEPIVQVDVKVETQKEAETPVKAEPKTEESPKAAPEIEAQTETEKPFSPNFGLSGVFEEQNPSYYGIVLYTLSYDSRAQAEVSSWSKKGFRAYVHKWEISTDKLKYIVALGQFATAQDAKAAALTLPAPFNEDKNHYIKRLKP